MHEGEEDDARPGGTTSTRGQDSPWKSIRITEDGIACRILIQNEQLEQVDTFPYLGSLIRKYVHGVVNPRIEDGKRTVQNRSCRIPSHANPILWIKKQKFVYRGTPRQVVGAFLFSFY